MAGIVEHGEGVGGAVTVIEVTPGDADPGQIVVAGVVEGVEVEQGRRGWC